jgi:flagellin-like protein
MKLRRYRRRRRGVSPILATIFLLGITIVLAGVLVAFRPVYPSQWISISYLADQVGSAPVWGDGTDCKTVNGVETCPDLPVLYITMTGVSPSNLPITNLVFVLYCNGTVYLEATLSAMATLPGTGENTPGPDAPQLQHCGTYTPPAAAYNRLAYFTQIDPGSTYLRPGDTLVLYTRTFNAPISGFTVYPDEDFHGVPPTCWSVPNACTIVLYYNGPTSELAMVLPLYGLATG